MEIIFFSHVYALQTGCVHCDLFCSLHLPSLRDCYKSHDHVLSWETSSELKPILHLKAATIVFHYVQNYYANLLQISFHDWNGLFPYYSEKSRLYHPCLRFRSAARVHLECVANRTRLLAAIKMDIILMPLCDDTNASHWSSKNSL